MVKQNRGCIAMQKLKIYRLLIIFILTFLIPLVKAEAKQHKKISNHKKHSVKKHYKKVKIQKVSYHIGNIVYHDDIPANKNVVKYAIGLLGTNYRFGGSSINGIDCSSFVQNVFKLEGIELPRTAREQALYGYFVSKENLKPGDLLFFATYARYPSHVGIYIGDGKMIHASSRGDRVEITSINQEYYQRRFLFAKRIPPKDFEPEVKYNSEFSSTDDLMEYLYGKN